jgi:host factor-I protein
VDNDNALNVQNGFFNQVRKDRTRVTIFLNNGQKISGTIKSFDRFTLLLDTKNGEQIVFKHAVSTVSIFRPPEPHAKERERQFGNFIDLEGKKET